MTPPYGHDPNGAMLDCHRCGWRFRTIERLRRHQDDDQDLCHEMAKHLPQQHPQDG